MAANATHVFGFGSLRSPPSSGVAGSARSRFEKMPNLTSRHPRRETPGPRTLASSPDGPGDHDEALVSPQLQVRPHLFFEIGILRPQRDLQHPPHRLTLLLQRQQLGNSPHRPIRSRITRRVQRPQIQHRLLRHQPLVRSQRTLIHRGNLAASCALFRTGKQPR